MDTEIPPIFTIHMDMRTYPRFIVWGNIAWLGILIDARPLKHVYAGV